MSMCAALRAALAEVEAKSVDGAARLLAEQYATALDNGGDLDKIGPKLLAVLVELQLTPKARALARLAGPAATKGGSADAPKRNPADELRARRAARLADTAAVDTATP